LSVLILVCFYVADARKAFSFPRAAAEKSASVSERVANKRFTERFRQRGER
jgi:hypothetical protein